MHARFATFLAAVAVAVASTGPTEVAAAPIVHRSVHRALQNGHNVNVVIAMKPKTNVLESFQESAYRTRTERINALKAQLTEANQAATEPLSQLLSKEATGEGIEIKKNWITSSITVKNANAELLDKIIQLEGVAEIREEKVIRLETPQFEKELEAVQGHEWGVARIGAPKVWADGTMGQNVVVGVIDSGARATHVALKKSFAGANYGWYDPEAQKAEPYDVDGHGTHVAGTIAGSMGVGVAPAAKWMMCKGCREEGCPESDLVECGQFMLCPTLPDASKPDCSKAPRIINNSWGGGQGEFWYKPVVDAWIKAGIMPVFALGNEGPECGTASSPGDYREVIGVSSMNMDDGARRTSSKGPTVFGTMKPDIAAPGGLIRSAWNTTDSAFKTISGTSMASPHVAGAIALLLSQEPELTYSEVKIRLYTTTDQKLAPSNYTCGGTTDANWPNNQYGHGRLNIFTAYQGFRPAPTPAPTTPAPTTVTPAPTPTPSFPANKYDAECKRLWMKELCPANSHCIWSDARQLCVGNPDFKEPTAN